MATAQSLYDAYCIKVTPFQLVAAIQLIIRTGVIVLGICFSLGKPLIAGYRPRKISIAVRHRPDFPIAELLCCRQVDVDEIWIAAVEAERSRACRDLRPVGDLVKLDAIDDVRRQVPVVASITQRKNDCHLVDALDIPGSEGAVLFGDPVDRDRRPKHFLQGQRLQSGSARAIGLEPRQWIWLRLCLRCAYSDVDQSVAWSSTSLNQRNRDAEAPGRVCVPAAPVRRIGEIKARRKRRTSRDAHCLARLRDRPGKGRRGSNRNQQRAGHH